MPYKDPAKQREYLRTWRRNQKLRAFRTPSQRTARNAPPYRGRFPHPAVARTSPAVDQKALKMSPDDAPQTGREATQAYRMNRTQITVPRTGAKTAPILRPPVVLPKAKSRQVVIPMAAMAVDMLSRLF